MVDLSIIIVNFNAYQMTSDCINSVITNTNGIEYEIIVVDNASVDESRLNFQTDTRINYHYNDSNIGFGRANNIGIKHSRGRNILFLNNDTILTGNSLYVLSQYLDSNDRVGACGANLISRKGELCTSYGSYFPGLFSEFNRLCRYFPSHLLYRNNEHSNSTEKIRNVAYISGADLMVKRSVLEQVGYFNPSFFLFYEETELCFRIRKAGFRIANIPGEKIIHLESSSIAPNCVAQKWKEDLMHESCEIFLAQTRSAAYQRIWYALYNFTEWTKMPFDKKRRRSKDIISFSVFPRVSAHSNSFTEMLVSEINKHTKHLVINHPSQYSFLDCSKKWYWGDTIIFCSEEGNSTCIPSVRTLKKMQKSHRLIFASNKESLSQSDQTIAKYCNSVIYGKDPLRIINKIGLC